MRSSIFFAASLSCMVIADPAQASWSNKTFSKEGVYGIPSCSGVYIIKKDGEPYYIGRSKNSIYERLNRHVSGQGSRKVAEILDKGYKLTVEYECLSSPEQMEALLIQDLGTSRYGNLRRETDPADWSDYPDLRP